MSGKNTETLIAEWDMAQDAWVSGPFDDVLEQGDALSGAGDALAAALRVSQERERTLRELLAEVGTALERVQFDAHDRDWGRNLHRKVALAVASSGGQTQEDEQDLGVGQSPPCVPQSGEDTPC